MTAEEGAVEEKQVSEPQAVPNERVGGRETVIEEMRRRARHESDYGVLDLVSVVEKVRKLELNLSDSVRISFYTCELGRTGVGQFSRVARDIGRRLLKSAFGCANFLPELLSFVPLVHLSIDGVSSIFLRFREAPFVRARFLLFLGACFELVAISFDTSLIYRDPLFSAFGWSASRFSTVEAWILGCRKGASAFVR